jgi:hypothetical protein
VRSHALLRGEAVVATAQEPQIREVGIAVVGERIDVVDLLPLSALAACPVGCDEGALAAVADEYNIPDFVRDVTRWFGAIALPPVGVKTR